jgi:molecular chaperone HtpG
MVARESGNISIHTENILPIIKKWLYSDKDIFVRELVSNASDAINKFKRLVSMGEAKAPADTRYQIRVVVNKKEKTIKFIDNGIGMTADEVKKYINQIAFSGAVDFLEKYKDKADEGKHIIGHFGLGFYSAFMVSEKVTIDTLSYQTGAEAVKWTSTGESEYTIEESDRAERGTTVTLFISDEGKEFLDAITMRQTLLKYCSFMPYELYFEEEGSKGKKKEDSKEEEKPLNDTSPLWLKAPKDCTDEEYKEFYKKVFHEFNDPLFWIHLNMDYPFKLKGILYFPKLKHEFEIREGEIKLFYNQVFVADNIKEVIPEFLMLLKGVMDCPDLPLNVSRSFLQNDGYVNKISGNISKKVADKLKSLFEKERDNYNKYWDDINPFVKYGCIKEQKFYEKIKDIILFKTIGGEYITLKDYFERSDKHGKTVFYATDERQQAQYIKMFREQGMEAVVLSSMIDTHFIQFLERNEKDIKFTRVDSEITDNLKEEAGESGKDDLKKADESLEKIFKDALKDDKLKIKVESLKSSSLPAVMLLSEESRRMQDMSRMFGGADMEHLFPSEQTLVVNRKSELIQSLIKMSEDKTRENDVKIICEKVYDLAMLGHKQLEPDVMTRFIERSSQILARIAQ